MLVPLPLTSADVSFVLDDANIIISNDMHKSYYHDCPPSSSPAEDRTMPPPPSRSAEINGYSNSLLLDYNNTESLEPTPIYESSIPYDESKEDAILSFIALVRTAEQRNKVYNDDFPLGTDHEDDADAKFSRSQRKRRWSCVKSVDQPRTLLDVHHQGPEEAKKQRTQSEWRPCPPRPHI